MSTKRLSPKWFVAQMTVQRINAHLSDFVRDVLSHVLHWHEQPVLVRVFWRRHGTVRIALRRLLVWSWTHRSHHVDAVQDVRLAAGQSDPIPRWLRVAGRLTEQRAGRHCRRCRRSLMVITCSCTTPSVSTLNSLQASIVIRSTVYKKLSCSRNVVTHRKTLTNCQLNISPLFNFYLTFSFS